MKKLEVYLAGLISTDFPLSLEWRPIAAAQLEAAGFAVRSPLAGKGNLKCVTTDGGITSTVTSNRSITLRDYRDVSECDIILAHLGLFLSKRPLVGTIAELAWAWQLRKPVIAVAADDDYLMRKHPFISEFVSQYVSTESEACEFITDYYGRVKP
jgi:nucleoside 2-deoxyribosyltransferase